MSPHFMQFHSDNFTDAGRTPWGGSTIAKHIKNQLDLNFPPIIGESWEFSTMKELPSICKISSDSTFADFLENETNAGIWLSDGHRKAWGQKTPLLVKYIDARRNLSVQVHPDIGDFSRDASVCGKWEAWIVLKTKPGAGIYYGVKSGITREQLRSAVYGGEAVEDLLQFCPVRPGDLISIPPRTVHALGAGVCVLEPQILFPGKSPISLRLYDWHHRYDENGNLSQTGEFRTLHVDEALDLIDLRPQANTPDICNILRDLPCHACEEQPAGVRCYHPMPMLTLCEVCGSGPVEPAPVGELAAVVVVKGQLEIFVDNEHYSLIQGESGALAANVKNVRFLCKKAWVQVIYCRPGMSSPLPENADPHAH